MDLAGYFESDSLSENLRTIIPRVTLVQEQESNSSDSEYTRQESCLNKKIRIFGKNVDSLFLTGEFEWEIQGSMADVSSSLMLNDDRDDEGLGVLALPPLDITEDTNETPSPMDTGSLQALPSSGNNSNSFISSNFILVQPLNWICSLIRNQMRESSPYHHGSIVTMTYFRICKGLYLLALPTIQWTWSLLWT